MMSKIKFENMQGIMNKVRINEMVADFLMSVFTMKLYQFKKVIKCPLISEFINSIDSKKVSS